MRPFFVYGTLLPGQPNHDLWENKITNQMPATIWAATLYDLGGYPMLIEGHDAVVNGMVIEVAPSAYEQVLANIDNLEHYDDNKRGNSVYLREARQIQLTDGSQCVAWVYVGQEKYVSGLSPIGSDWIKYSAENQIEKMQALHNITTAFPAQDQSKIKTVMG